MRPTLKVQQIVQEWSDDLGVWITPRVARAAKFASGLAVTIEVVPEGILVRRLASEAKLSLAQKLKAFDPARHGGEAMAEAASAGGEAF